MISLSGLIASAWPARLALFGPCHGSSVALLEDLESCVQGGMPPGECCYEVVTEASSEC
jgi:hypothetical protein